MLTVDLNRLALTPGQLCLDIGCGEGRHSLAAHAFEGVYALGLDLCTKDLATAASRIADMQVHCPKGAIAFGAGDATQLPIADEQVDVVIASEILEHIPDYLQVLKEAMRVLKPGGRLLYVTCSILRAENDEVIGSFCDGPDVASQLFQLDNGVRCEYGWQILPQDDGGDGLYFSLLKKPSS